MLKLQVSKDCVIVCPDTCAEIRRYDFSDIFLGRGYFPAAWKALRWLTGSKRMHGWKSLSSPGCQFWFSRDEAGLKLLLSFRWWIRSESVISAYFLLVCLPDSPLASAANDPNTISYQNLLAQGNKGNGLWMLRFTVPFTPGFSVKQGCNAACVICWYCLRCTLIWPPKLLSWHLSCFLLSFLG